MAFGAGTPELSVAYDLRNHGFAEFIGCPELVIDLKDLKKGGLLKRTREVFDVKEKYQQKFLVKIAAISKQQKLFLKKINL